MPYKHPVSITQTRQLLNGICRAGWLKNGLINSISASTHTMKGIFLLRLLAHQPVSISVGKLIVAVTVKLLLKPQDRFVLNCRI